MRAEPKVWTLLALMAASLFAPCRVHGATPIAGRPVSEVLQEAAAAGLKIVYSEALVTPELRVLDEPQATEPVARLREILAPHALALEALAGDAFVVVQAGRANGDEPAAALEEVRVLSSRYRLEGTRADPPFSLGTSELESQPALLEDAARGVRRFPGTAGNSFSSRVFVRGGLSDENLIVLDGVPLQEPFHLAGLPADLSLFDPAILDRIDFYAGVLPLEFGDRMSSVMDMSTRAPADAFGGRASLGTMHASVLLEDALPAAGQGDWFVFARRGLLDQIAKLADAELGRPRLADAAARVRYPLRDGSVLVLGGLASDDDIELSQREGIEISRGEADRGYIWSALESRWGASSVRTLLAHTSTSIHRTGVLQDPAGSSGLVNDSRLTSTTLLRQEWRRPFAAGGVLRWGGAARRDHTDYAYSREVAYPSEIAALYGQPAASQLAFTGTVRLDEYEAYAGASRNFGSRWSAEGGLRWTLADYSTGQEHDGWDPRLALLYHVSPSSRIRLAWGRMRQTWAASELPLETNGTLFEDDSVSITRLLGWEHEFGSGLEARVELYDKKVHAPRARRENLLDPITLIPDLRPDAIVIDPDLARVTGADVHVSGPLYPDVAGWDLTGWLSYSWSHARDVIDREEVPRSWDQRHAFAAGLSFDRGPWLLGGVLTVRSDWPITPILSAPGALGIGLGKRNSEREGLFVTLDLRAERRFRIAWGELRAVLELQNATNRANPCCTEIRFERDATGALSARELHRTWAPLIPQLSVAWEF